MSIVKNITVAAFLGLASAAVVIPAAPAQAATILDIQSLVVTYTTILTAQADALRVIVNSGGTSSQDGIAAQAELQLLLARIAQLNQLGPQLAGLPGAVLDSIANFLQTEISAA
jgi:hypothetical protein